MLFNCLWDTGADISLIALTDLQYFNPIPDIGSLSFPIKCTDFRGNALQKDANQCDKEPLVRFFVVLQARVNHRKFHFPFHCYDGPLSQVILGADFMFASGISPHLRTSRLVYLRELLPVSATTDFSSLPPASLEVDPELACFRYIQQLQNPRGIQGVPVVCALKAPELPADLTIELLPDDPKNFAKPRRCIDGYDLADCEHLLYPVQEYILLPGEEKLISASTKFFKLRKGFRYAFLSLSRPPFYDVSLSPKWDPSEAGQGEHSMQFRLSSSLGVTLYPTVPFAIVQRIFNPSDLTCSVALLDPQSALPESTRTLSGSATSLPSSNSSFPEFSTFKPQPYRDYPFPDELGEWPMVPDWTPEEIKAAEPEYDKWVTHEDNHIYLTPRPNVKLVNDHPSLSKGQRVLISKMIADLPLGMWSTEDPEKLPGVPMTDIAIRVHLINDRPIAVKIRRMSPAESEAATREINKWVVMGIYEQTQSAYRCNVIFVEKKGTKEVRMCINFVPLNNITVKDKYPLPNMDSLLSFIAESEYLTSTDIRLGFHNFYIHPDDRHKLAFATAEGHWQPTRLPFGWCNGPSIFMRQMNITHWNMHQAVLMFLDDAILRTPPGTKNLKQHIMQFCVVAANDHRRGLIYETRKAQVACQKIKLLGFTVDGEGIAPSWKNTLFPSLLARNHTTVASLQSTIGSLQWLRRFVPSFSSIIQPLFTQLRRGMKSGNHAIEFTPECVQAIKTIESYITAVPKLHHSHANQDKNIYLVIGASAFSASIYQFNPSIKNASNQLVAFWSKTWPLSVDSYSAPEKYALAIREILKFYAYLLVGVPTISFYTSNAIFTAIVQDQSQWSTRMQRFLAGSVQHNCVYRLSQDSRCSELQQLMQHVPEESETITAYNATALQTLISQQPFGVDFNSEKILNLPMAFIDGACSKVAKDLVEGGWACFWRKGSLYNASGSCLFPPFTNNRSEMEALLHCIEIRQGMKKANEPWIAVSDSAYLCDIINLHQKNWQEIAQPNPQNPKQLLRVIVNSQGMEVLNCDLWLKVFDALKQTKVHITHVVRKFTEQADQLAKGVLKQRKQLLNTLNCPDTDIPMREAHINAYVELPSDNESSVPFSMREALTEEFEEAISEENDNDAEMEGEALDAASPEDNDPFEGEEFDLFVDSEEEDEPSPDIDLSRPDFYNHLDPAIRLPAWEKNMISTKELTQHLPARFKLEEPHLNEFGMIMCALPTSQVQDTFCSLIINHLKGSPNLLPQEIDRTLHRYSLESVTNTLMILTHSKQKRFVVPQVLQEPIIAFFHRAAAFGAHNSSDPTLLHIQRYFWWEGLSRQVKSYCQSCTTCIASKKPTGKLPGYLTPAPLPPGPWYKVHCDTIRGLPKSNHIQNVLVLQCSYSKFILTAPMSSISATSTISSLTTWFTIFGAPQIFVADRGGEFHSAAVIAFLKLWGVKPRFSAAYNPQANGQAEAAVKIVSRRLYSVLYEYHRDRPPPYEYKSWVAYLPYVTMSYNCSPNKITGFSPYEIIYGRPASFPLPNPELNIPVNTAEKLWDYMLQVRSSIAAAQKIITDKLTNRREQIKRMFDRFRSPLTIDEGDYVFVYYAPTMKHQKLHPRAYGPFPVIHVSRLAGTQEPVGVTVNIGSAEQPLLKRFARGRVHPFRYLHRDINWNRFKDYAERCHQENHPDSDEVIDEVINNQALDLSTTNAVSAISLSSVFEWAPVDWEDHSTVAPLLQYINAYDARQLYEPIYSITGHLGNCVVPVPLCHQYNDC